MKSATYRVFSGVFICMGIFFLVANILIMVPSMKFRKTAQEVTGKIVEIKQKRLGGGRYIRTVYVDFTYEGKKYEKVQMNQYSNGMKVGEKLDLLIDPNNPTEVRTVDGDRNGGILLTIVGVISLAIGILPRVLKRKKKET